MVNNILCLLLLLIYIFGEIVFGTFFVTLLCISIILITLYEIITKKNFFNSELGMYRTFNFITNLLALQTIYIYNLYDNSYNYILYLILGLILTFDIDAYYVTVYNYNNLKIYKLQLFQQVNWYYYLLSNDSLDKTSVKGLTDYNKEELLENNHLLMEEILEDYDFLKEKEKAEEYLYKLSLVSNTKIAYIILKDFYIFFLHFTNKINYNLYNNEYPEEQIDYLNYIFEKLTYINETVIKKLSFDKDNKEIKNIEELYKEMSSVIKDINKKC